MDPREESPIFKKEINRFFKSNQKIKEALDLFKISEDQYIKAIRSTEPQVTTSNKTIIEIEV
jgi:hypothetical protein